MPPSGFLISCARLRISSLLACAWSSSALLAVLARLLLDLDQLDQHSPRAVGLAHDHVHRQRLAVPAPAQLARRSAAAANSLRAHRASASAQQRRVGEPVEHRAAQQRCAATARARLRARRWRTAAAIGVRPRPPSWPAGRRPRSGRAAARRAGIGPPSGAAGLAAAGRRCQLALDGGDVALLARDAGLHLGHAIQVPLVVALVAAALGLAVVVFLAQLGAARSSSCAARSRGCARASQSRARWLAGSTVASAAARRRRCGAARPRRGRRALHHGDRCRPRSAAAALLGFLRWRCRCRSLPGSGRRSGAGAPAPAALAATAQARAASTMLRRKASSRRAAQDGARSIAQLRAGQLRRALECHTNEEDGRAAWPSLAAAGRRKPLPGAHSE